MFLIHFPKLFIKQSKGNDNFGTGRGLEVFTDQPQTIIQSYNIYILKPNYVQENKTQNV